MTTSYPGVYVQEISSGVRTITGVATSITAFIGRAVRGPTDTPVTINSYADFERTFGGLWAQATLGYAVRDFYRNGGSQAIIVRLFHPLFANDGDRAAAVAAAAAVVKAATDEAAKAGSTPATVAVAAQTAAGTYTTDPAMGVAQAIAAAATAASTASGATVDTVVAAAQAAAETATAPDFASLTVSGLGLRALYPGAWGNGLQATIDQDVTGPDAANLFNLSVRDGATGRVEVHRNVSVTPGHTRLVDAVLKNESTLVAAVTPLPATRPAAAADVGVAAADAATDGGPIDTGDFTGTGKQAAKQGLYALADADLFNMLCIPPFTVDGDMDYGGLLPDAVAYCEARRAMLLVDPPVAWTTKDAAKQGVATLGTTSANAALYFPRLTEVDPLRGNGRYDVVPCGAVAGIYARTDSARGVWKAPAGLDATVNGVVALSVPLNDPENGELNPLGVNCLRTLPAAGTLVWGARTRAGDDRLASEWKYVPVRRTALYIEESLYRGTQWVVFEPNDEPLWAQIRLNIGAFLHNLFRQGAFQGAKPADAYFVKCDKETTTQNDVDAGIVNIVVGFAPLKPAEFVIITLQQIAGAVQA
ncbi:phage tail sheath family protein [Specibacter cremeus]|uniref:phage tail sheath family protein n=1 Tax=Specibacter cremeus TaxID=1629051 RepID=UPI00197B990E|nr:phage tail sheath C-terminal domain-containing protein [Specibacter cremeus]